MSDVRDFFQKALNVNRAAHSFEDPFVNQQDSQSRSFVWHRQTRKKGNDSIQLAPPYQQVAMPFGPGFCHKCKLDYNTDPVSLLESGKCGHDLCKACYAAYYSSSPTGCAADGCIVVMHPWDFYQLQIVNGGHQRVAYPTQGPTAPAAPASGGTGQREIPVQLFSGTQDTWSDAQMQTNHSPQQQSYPPQGPPPEGDIYNQHQQQGQCQGYYGGHPNSSPVSYHEPYPAPPSSQPRQFDSTQGYSTNADPYESSPSPTPPPQYGDQGHPSDLDNGIARPQRSQTYDFSPPQFLSETRKHSATFDYNPGYGNGF